MRHRLVAPGCEWLVPFAETRIKVLLGLGSPYADQSFEVNGCQVRVRVEPGHEYIRIEGERYSVLYEFFTTGAVLNPNKSLPLPQFDQLNNPGSVTRISVGRDTRNKDKKKLTSTPIWSSLHTPPDPLPADQLTWASVDRRWWAQNHIWLGGGKLYEDNFASIFSQPSEHFGSYHWYYNNDKSELVTSCRASGPGASIGNLRPVTDDVAYLCTIVPAPKFAKFSYYPDTVGVRDVALYTSLGLYDTWSEPVGNLTSDYPYAWLDTRISVRPSFRDSSDLLQASPTNTFSIADPQKTFESIRFNPESTNESQSANTFDIPPAVYKGRSLFVGAGMVGPFVHWRNAALHKAKGPEGEEVKVIVLTDTHNGFMFYVADNYATSVPQPTTEELGAAPIGESYRNLDSTKWVRVKPTMPSWVSLPSDDAPYNERTWSWRFNKTATRAVCTPVNSSPGYRYMTLTYLSTIYGSMNVAGIYNYQEVGSVPVEVYSIPQVSPELAAEIDARMASVYAATGRLPAHGRSGTSAYYYIKYGGEYYGLHNVHYLDPRWAMTSVVAPYVILAKDITPGVVEVEISVGVSYDELGKAVLSPTVNVVYSDYYDESGKIYSDAAYYVKTPRASKASTSLVIENQPDDDDLLLSHIVCRGRTSASAPDPHRQVFPYAWYVVANKTKNNTVTTLCIQAQGNTNVYSTVFFGVQQPDYSYVYGSFATMFCVIIAHDLRYLSFITATYYRRTVLKNDVLAAFWGMARVADHNLAPRIELRILGEPIKTVDYSDPLYSGFSGTVIDPSVFGLQPVEGVYERYGRMHLGSEPVIGTPLSFDDGLSNPLTDNCGVTAPEKKQLMQSFLPLTTSGQYYTTFTFTPTGDYAVYFDARSAMWPAPTGTNADGMLDIIKVDKQYTTHLAEFNKAFGKTMTYADIPIDETPTTGRFGMNGIFMYNMPGDQPFDVPPKP